MVISADEYPWKGEYLDLAGNQLHYLDEGEGEPLVMVHGNPTWSFYYRNLVKAFSDRHRCIVPDHIGCGMSDKPGVDAYPYTLRQRVDDLETLLEKLEVQDNITLVVHDWGGMIGLTYAHRHPEKIKRLVILNTGAFQLPKSKGFPWSLWFCRSFFGPLLVRGFNAFCLAAVYWCATRKKLTAEIEHGYLAPYDNWEDRAAILRFVQDIPLKRSDVGHQLISEVEANLEQFRKIPAVICWGDKDFVFDKHFLKIWREKLPAATVHQWEDSGHYILEDRGEEIIEIVDQFLKDNPIKKTRKK
jgi:cis-3-alkyl-4-acyloxetan-2-one decarboxylase